MCYLCAIEPQAPQTLQDPGLQEPNPASVQLHYDGKGRIGCKNDVVNHAGMIWHPHVIGTGYWTRPMVSYHASPASNKSLTLELYQNSFPSSPPAGVL